MAKVSVRFCIRTRELYALWFRNTNNLDLSTELISLIGHREEIQKLAFRDIGVSCMAQEKKQQLTTEENQIQQGLHYINFGNFGIL